MLDTLSVLKFDEVVIRRFLSFEEIGRGRGGP
jgi:hypothetical protein